MEHHSNRRHNLKTTTRKNKILSRNKPNNSILRKLRRQLRRSTSSPRTFFIRSNRSMASRSNLHRRHSPIFPRLRNFQRPNKIRIQRHWRLLRNATPLNRILKQDKTPSNFSNLQRNKTRILRAPRSRNSQRSNKTSFQKPTTKLRHNRRCPQKHTRQNFSLDRKNQN